MTRRPIQLIIAGILLCGTALGDDFFVGGPLTSQTDRVHCSVANLHPTKNVTVFFRFHQDGLCNVIGGHISQFLAPGGVSSTVISHTPTGSFPTNFFCTARVVPSDGGRFKNSIVGTFSVADSDGAVRGAVPLQWVKRIPDCLQTP